MDTNPLIGTSGWVYEHWKGIFYPEGLPQAQQLRFYTAHFPTVEINYSFYHLPSRANFESWREQTPEDFVFAVKASRYLSHIKRLLNCAEPLGRFLENAAGLGSKMGVILFQFPPHWGKNIERLSAFLNLLPPNRRYAFEFRHPSWLSFNVYATLREHNCALCLPDHPTMPLDLQLTADFTYIRMHGGAYSIGYSDEELEIWAQRIKEYVRQNIQVYVYFNNDAEGYAVSNARKLMAMLTGR
ncbi:MAG: DUF72 domain-containing protein [Chloroflexi bacterium]|nr:DUF72 domain-containing protein [Chloroflexota bacterium]MCL5075952.1 DUF72 domain-containing protein [Chloroflexota bacterium]